MTITRQEVKTIYDIEIKFNECWDLLMKFNSKSSNEIIYKDLADFLKDKNYDHKDVAKEIIESFTMANWHSQFVKFMIEELGFDGVVNFGLYNKKKNSYTCSVYRYGDQINN
jgi:hypothetical protein